MTQLLSESTLSALRFDANGLIPVVVQNQADGKVLMLAWTNLDALKLTLSTGLMHYWSRSRGKLWQKGESSGQTQRVQALYLDCDGDALLAMVEQHGVACHTGRESCFFSEFTDDGLTIISDPLVSPEQLYGKE